MVQRKAPDKLGIKDDTKNPVKTEKPSILLKSPASQNTESRNKGGPELKKMMKKSRSIKRSEFDCLRSNSTKRRAKTKPAAAAPAADAVVHVAMVAPLKLSPVKVPATQKQPQVKIPETPPNYMKSTTSSSARKERLPVSPVISKASSDSKIHVRKDLNSLKKQSVSVSGQKPGRTLTKTPSLRPVRTLTKTSSIKAGRSSAKKNSGVALFSDQNIRKNTCASTLKDSKFPSYVALHPGGTEAEGISVMKVCPYTYCSLNGHHHAELPPLKQFLSARRRLLKTQKSMRLKSLPSIKRRPTEKPKEDIDAGQMYFNKESTTSEDEDSAGMDFFVEVYAQLKDNTDKSMVECTDDYGDQEKIGFSFDFHNSYTDGTEMDVEDDGGHFAKSPDYASDSATSFEDNINQDIDFITEEMDTQMVSLEYIQTKDVEEHTSCYHMEAGAGLASNKAGESETDDSIFDASGMDWEEGQVVDTDRDNDETVCSQVFADIELHDELTSKAVDIIKNCYEEVTVHEELHMVHGEDNDGLYEEVELSDITSSEESDALSGPSLPSNEDALENSKANSEVKDQDPEIIKLLIIGTSSEVTEDLLLKEQNNNHSEPEMPLNTVPDDQDAVAEEGPNPQEPTGKSQVLDSVAFKNEEIISVPDANVDGAKMAEDNEDQLEGMKHSIPRTAFSDEQNCTEGINLKSVADSSTGCVTMEVDDETGAGKITVTKAARSPDEAQQENSSNFYKRNRFPRPIADFEEPREFNPRGPNFLPLEPEQDPETVDLRHQMMDDRKNSEEWMLDYALRQAVSKLAPARKRKVALLVEAFEAVTPMRKYEIHLPHTPTGFAHTRFMQACS